MVWSIHQRKQFAAWEKMRFARQSRDVACNPVRPGSEIAVREGNPGPYGHLVGQRLRVGYYSRNDGLNVIWIVSPGAEYAETTDHSHLRQYFTVIRDSGETDYYGVNRPVLEAL